MTPVVVEYLVVLQLHKASCPLSIARRPLNHRSHEGKPEFRRDVFNRSAWLGRGVQYPL